MYSTLNKNITNLSNQLSSNNGNGYIQYAGGGTALEAMKNATNYINGPHPNTTLDYYNTSGQKINSPSTNTNKTNTTTTTAPTIDTSTLGGGTSSGGGYDYASMINGILEQQRAAAQQAYGVARSNLNRAFDTTASTLRNNLDNALGQLSDNFNYGQQVANDDAAKSLRESYINYMLNKKNMNQNLSLAGISGGATESSLANLYNNYGNARNNINTTLADNMSKLINSYNNNLAGIEQQYNNSYADAMNNYTNNLNQLEMALANNIAGSYSGGTLTNLANYAATLQALTGDMLGTAQNYTPSENLLGVDNLTLGQGSNESGTSNYAKVEALKKMLQTMESTGAGKTLQLQALIQNGASKDLAMQLMGY